MSNAAELAQVDPCGACPVVGELGDACDVCFAVVAGDGELVESLRARSARGILTRKHWLAELRRTAGRPGPGVGSGEVAGLRSTVDNWVRWQISTGADPTWAASKGRELAQGHESAVRAGAMPPPKPRTDGR